MHEAARGGSFQFKKKKADERDTERESTQPHFVCVPSANEWKSDERSGSHCEFMKFVRGWALLLLRRMVKKRPEGRGRKTDRQTREGELARACDDATGQWMN